MHALSTHRLQTSTTSLRTCLSCYRFSKRTAMYSCKHKRSICVILDFFLYTMHNR